MIQIEVPYTIRIKNHNFIHISKTYTKMYLKDDYKKIAPHVFPKVTRGAPRGFFKKSFKHAGNGHIRKHTLKWKIS